MISNNTYTCNKCLHYSDFFQLHINLSHASTKRSLPLHLKTENLNDPSDGDIADS